MATQKPVTVSYFPRSVADQLHIFLPSLIMSHGLLGVITLLATDATWIHPLTWTTAKTMSMHFFKADSLLLIGDLPQWKATKKPFYVSDGAELSPLYLDVDTVVAVRDPRQWNFTDLRGNLLVITESLDVVENIWPKFKLAPLMVILQENGGCDVYVWLPFKPGNCNRQPKLEFMTSCRNETVEGLKHSYVREFEPTNCTLTASLVPCAILVAEDKGNLVGAEVNILEALAHSMHMKLEIYRFGSRSLNSSLLRLWYYQKKYQNGSYCGYMSLLHKRIVDVAGGCLSISVESMSVGLLPSHLEDSSRWHLPGPQPIRQTYEFLNALPTKVWIAVALIGAASFVFSYAANSFKGLGHVTLWVLLRLLSMPSPPLSNTLIVRLFSVLLEFCAIVITTLYRSVLLYHLFINPMLVLETGEAGSQYGLIAHMRPGGREMLDYVNPHLKQLLLRPGKLIVSSSFQLDYSLLVENKTAMLMALTILDQARIRLRYSNIPYSAAVSVDKNTFSTLNFGFLLSPRHPLARPITVRLNVLIHAGLTELYVRRAMSSLPRDGITHKKGEKKPLGYSQLANVFYMWLIFMVLSLAVFILELAVNARSLRKEVAP